MKEWPGWPTGGGPLVSLREGRRRGEGKYYVGNKGARGTL